MTKKRYRKLAYALMQKIQAKHIEVCGKSADNWGKVLKGVSKVEFKAIDLKFKSYEEAWESIKPIREQYGM